MRSLRIACMFGCVVLVGAGCSSSSNESSTDGGGSLDATSAADGPPDAATPDAPSGSSDGNVAPLDAAHADATVADSAVNDAGLADATNGDMGLSDAAPADAAPADAAPADAFSTYDSANDGPVAVQGSVAKGPFLLGSSVTISSVDDAGNPTGMSFPTTTSDDLGNFSATFAYRGAALVSANGYFFNEVENALSASSVTLQSYAEFTNGGPQLATVNCVTALTSQRVKTLLGDGQSLAAAARQAQSELTSALAIGGSTFEAGASADQAGLFTGSAPERAYVFAVGAVTAEVAHQSTQAGSIEATIQQFINSTGGELAAGGTLGSTTMAEVALAQQCVDPEAVTSALAARVATVDGGVSVPDINLALDSDLDGIPNESDDCPLVADPSQQGIQGVCKYRHAAVTGISALGVAAAAAAAAQGDVDGVHGPDLVLLNMATNEIGTWLNDGSGNLGSPIVSPNIFPADASTDYGNGLAALGDMNGDGKADFVFMVENPNHDWVLAYAPGDRAGHFGIAISLFDFFLSAAPLHLDLVDVNGDSRLDVITALEDSTGGHLGIALAPSSGAWSGFSPLTASGLIQVADFAVGDVTGDLKPDILVASSLPGSGGLFTFVSNGDGTFTAHGPDTSSGTLLYNVALGDIDGDGFVDTVVSTAASRDLPTDTLVVRFGDNTLTPVASASVTDFFTPSNPCNLGFDMEEGENGASPMPFALGDITGDGKADIYVLYPNAVIVSQGRTFAAPVTFQPFAFAGDTLAGYYGPWLVDMNGDSKADLLLEASSGYVATIFNASDTHGW
jgi:hypothetical protein